MNEDDPAPTDVPPQAGPPRVDAHAHVFTRSLPLQPAAWHVPAADASAADYLDTLDRHGVGHGVLAAASLFADPNAYALAACRDNPRLRTTVIVPFDIGRSELEAMAADGAIGIRLQWRNVPQLPDLRSPACRRLLGYVGELGWHVQLHDDACRLPAHLAALEDAGVDIVVDHFGRPDEREGTAGAGFRRLLESVQAGRTWVKLCAAFRLASAQLASEAAAVLLREAGPERLVWGSDWPFAAFESEIDYAQTLREFARLVPDAAARRRIGGDTPMNLFFERHGHINEARPAA